MATPSALPEGGGFNGPSTPTSGGGGVLDTLRHRGGGGERDKPSSLLPPVAEAPVDAGALWRNLAGFWILGLINNFGYVVFLSAALDLLAAANLSPAVVLLANSLPSLIVQSAAPWFADRVPYWLRVSFIVVAGVGSFLVTSLFASIPLRLLGVVLGSLGSGLGEITFLSYTAYYNKNCVSAWSSGTGGAGILGAVSYVALTSAVDPKQALLISSPVPLVMAASFFLILGRKRRRGIEDAVVGDEGVGLLSDAVVNTHATDGGEKGVGVRNEMPPAVDGAPTASTKTRLLVQLLPYMTPLFFVYSMEYLINQAIDPVLLFPSSSYFSGREYEWYQAVYQVFVFISRSSVNIAPIRTLWLLQLPAVFQVANFVFLLLVAVYDFVPSIWIVFAIVCWEGLMGGSIYINSYYLISQKFSGADKEWALGATAQSYGLAITLAALVGIPLTPAVAALRASHAA